MSAARRSMSLWSRRLSMTAAFLALVLQLMFPAGFMAAAPGQAHGLPIVICSAQGQSVVDWDQLTAADSGAHKSKAPAKGMASCPFAGHATASGAPEPLAVAAPVAFVRTAETVRPYAVFPGRGLAAPPPPAIGPPLSA
jgi:hypothetical protein